MKKFLLPVFLVLSMLSSFAGAEEEPQRFFRLKFLNIIDAKTTGVKLGIVKAMYVDKQAKELYLLDLSNNRVVITDLNGFPLHTFPVFNDQDFSPIDIAVDSLGRVLLPGGNKIGAFNYRGKFEGFIELTGLPWEGGIGIQSIAIDQSGNIVLGGFGGGKHRIVTLDPSGKFVSQIEADNRFINVNGLTAYNGFIFLDSGYYTVWNLDAEGKEIKKFGTVSSLLGGFSMPTDLAIDEKNKRIIVVDANRMMAMLFEFNGIPVFEFGGPRMFRWPRAVAVDGDGRIYVAEGSGYVFAFEVIEEMSGEPRPQTAEAAEADQTQTPTLLPLPTTLPPPPPPPPTAIEEVARIVEEEARLLPVYFGVDRTGLTSEAKKTLDKNAEWLKQNATVVVDVRGYADSRGSDKYNLMLSGKRAKAVMDYLISKKIASERLILVPIGKEVLKDATEETLAKSRRVDFLVEKKPEPIKEIKPEPTPEPGNEGQDAGKAKEPAPESVNQGTPPEDIKQAEEPKKEGTGKEEPKEEPKKEAPEKKE